MSQKIDWLHPQFPQFLMTGIKPLSDEVMRRRENESVKKIETRSILTPLIGSTTESSINVTIRDCVKASKFLYTTGRSLLDGAAEIVPAQYEDNDHSGEVDLQIHAPQVIQQVPMDTSEITKNNSNSNQLFSINRQDSYSFECISIFQIENPITL